MMPKRRAVLLCIASAVLAAVLAGGSVLYYIYTGPLGRVYGIVNLVDQNFYKPVDRVKALEGAARGVVASVSDPYSVFMNKLEWENFNVRTSGAYSGIGITIGVKDNRIQMAQPMKGTPAEEAGLLANDVIVKVDGKLIYTSDEAASLIRGPAGTKVILTIMRGTASFDVTLTRREIIIPASTHSMMEKNVGYIELVSFNEHSAAETSKAVQDLKNQGAKVIILDLRYNGGGYVEQCRLIAEMFVPKGVLTTLKYKSQPDELYQTKGNGLGLPLFVLVNKGTASASEILAGAIQDRKSGTLIGDGTFGKGLVQGAFFLKDGSVVKVTTAEYLTPSGRAINGAGLEPDVKVAGDEAQLAKALELANVAISGPK
jgi:carboxyl-terminal processing protease